MAHIGTGIGQGKGSEHQSDMRVDSITTDARVTYMIERALLAQAISGWPLAVGPDRVFSAACLR